MPDSPLFSLIRCHLDFNDFHRYPQIKNKKRFFFLIIIFPLFGCSENVGKLGRNFFFFFKYFFNGFLNVRVFLLFRTQMLPFC